MNKEELLKEIMELPKIETNNPISAMNGINVDDLMSAIDRLNKIPDYNDLLKENQELKKQLENKYEKVGTLTSELLYEENTKLINQQKEFINYINDYIKLLKDKPDLVEEGQKDILEEILSKYQEIIGGK